MDRPTLYAQFDGLEVAGRRYALGEELAADVDRDTIAYLRAEGNFALAQPATGNPATMSTDGRALDQMGRPELIATFHAEALTLASDDELRRAIEIARDAREAQRNASDAPEDEPKPETPASDEPVQEGTTQTAAVDDVAKEDVVETTTKPKRTRAAD